MIAVVNPAAGRGTAEAQWRRIRDDLHRLGVNADTLVTSAPGDAETRSRRARLEGFRTFVAVGGDGTVHEVVNGLFDGNGFPRDLRLAVVPAGTGMDFARNVGAKRGHAAAVERVIRGRELCLDVGLVPREGRVFVNFMETGLGAAVVARVSQMGDRWPGRLSFFAAALSAAVTESNIRVRVETGGDFVYEGPAVSVVAANGRYFGGGMKIAPAARMDDGLLDLLILGDLGKLEFARQIWKIYPGKHVSHPKVVHLRASAVTVTTRDESLLDLDGELRGKGSCSATVLPRALTVLV